MLSRHVALVGAGFLAASGNFALASTYSAAVEALNPVSYYQFNGAITPGGTATDDGSRASSQTYGAGASAGAGVPGIGGQSLNIAAGNGATGTDAGLPAGNSVRTVAAWINTTTTSGGNVGATLA